ncbi:MAG TPA: glycogen debranching protein GlgX [Methylibium sp.]|uniref:glycogen debranching protein GlgX n=1 Tax=Methylibium sp. TaxID=2067992 RepID=UPI002DBAFB24|nr:glycogen debranching protein GlgX [Methylibium sp.]HEU4460835.1 glycogen debranching protein GlgX [Methylibium sp.]
MPKLRVRSGRPYPLGATWDGRGVNFALHSGAARAVQLCVFDDTGTHEIQRLEMTRHGRGAVWYGYVPDLQPGARYAWRVEGPTEPAAGQRCNKHKLLLDPYARSIVGEPQWSSAHYGYLPGEEAEEGYEGLNCSIEDSAAVMPKCEVVNDAFDWGDSTPPNTPWDRTVFYEVHVKGFTKQHPGVPEALRGTYAGLASPAAIDHLKQLGVTAVELLPVQAFFDDHRLVDLGLRNYWGYNSIGFFAPAARYAADQSTGGPVREFKQMVRALHEAGLEVILDVVYNHTAEGNHLGPTLSFKGIDHYTYYRLSPPDRRYNFDFTGTGNTLDTTVPVVNRLIVDSLRYWVTEMGVDGFRFDLAVTLGRGKVDFSHDSAFFHAIALDPVVSQVKLIAEPWDLGPDGYRVGGFPKPWAEWNGTYRDTVRSFWCQKEGALNTLAQRMWGSSDLYEHAGRTPNASVNLVTVHDGFTLHDLVSYNGKHNEANGEDNRDGESHNRSWNCGAEGDTCDEVVLVQRERLKRNLLATLLLSQGTPLLLGGDEMGRTQRGNNNGYCQDNEISWFDWRMTPERSRLLDFTRRLVWLRRELPLLRLPRWFRADEGDGVNEVRWRLPDGSEATAAHWTDAGFRAVAALMCSADDDALGAAVLLILNGGDDPADFVLPEVNGRAWFPRIDTSTRTGFPVADGQPLEGSARCAGRALFLLTQPRV